MPRSVSKTLKMGILGVWFISTNSKIIFDTITASTRILELHVMKEIAKIGRACRANYWDNVELISSEKIGVDKPIQFNGNSILMEALRTCTLNFTIEKEIHKRNLRPVKRNWNEKVFPENRARNQQTSYYWLNLLNTLGSIYLLYFYCYSNVESVITFMTIFIHVLRCFNLRDLLPGLHAWSE